MPDKDPYVCGCKEEDYEFFCDKEKPYIGKPIIESKPGSIIGMIVAIPFTLCVGLMVVAIAIGPILIGLCAAMIGLCAAAIGALAFTIGWVEAKAIFYAKYYLWCIKRKFWFKKKNISKRREL